jgi:hypothetical protein
MIQTPWTSQSCGQRAGMLVMDSAALGWWTTSTWTLMLCMETRTTVACAMEPLSCCGSGVRVTTSAGRLFPGVSSPDFGLHVYNFLLTATGYLSQILCTSRLIRNSKSCITTNKINCMINIDYWTLWFVWRALWQFGCYYFCSITHTSIPK